LKIKLQIILSLFSFIVASQNNNADSLGKLLVSTIHDTIRCMVIDELLGAEIDPKEKAIYFRDLKKLTLDRQVKNESEAEKIVYQTYSIIYMVWKSHFDRDLKKYPEAIKTCEDALKLANEKLYPNARARVFHSLGSTYEAMGKPQTAIEYFEKSISLVKIHSTKIELAKRLNNIALVYEKVGMMTKAAEDIEKSIELRKELKDDKGLAVCYNNLGRILHDIGNIPKALICYEKSLKLRESTGDKKGLAITLSNVANVYVKLGSREKAMQYYLKSLDIRIQTGDKKSMAIGYMNIARQCALEQDTTRARIYFEKGYELAKKIGDKQLISRYYSHQGSELLKKGEYDRALEYYKKSLELRKTLGDKKEVASGLDMMSNAYFKKNDLQNAKKCALEAHKICLEMGHPEGIQSTSKALSEIYDKLGKPGEALDAFKLYIRMRDSLNNETNRRSSLRSQLKYEYDKKAAADSVAHAKEDEIRTAELSRQSAEIKVKKNQQYALYGGLLLVLLFSVFMLNRYRVAQKQKVIIEEQKVDVEKAKELVDQKQSEILDSIKYAKKIQTAQLPSERFLERNLERLKKE
jgi:tetratricopeptide (TPR) repeat protein